jgi:hypothetical protein
LAIIDVSATTKKAIPVQKRSPPETKYTPAATIITGIRTKKDFMRTIITKPMITRIIRKVKSNLARPKLLKIEYIIDNNLQNS